MRLRLAGIVQASEETAAILDNWGQMHAADGGVVSRMPYKACLPSRLSSQGAIGIPLGDALTTDPDALTGLMRERTLRNTIDNVVELWIDDSGPHLKRNGDFAGGCSSTQRLPARRLATGRPTLLLCSSFPLPLSC
jgi:hypothetical protein